MLPRALSSFWTHFCRRPRTTPSHTTHKQQRTTPPPYKQHYTLYPIIISTHCLLGSHQPCQEKLLLLATPVLAARAFLRASTGRASSADLNISALPNHLVHTTCVRARARERRARSTHILGISHTGMASTTALPTSGFFSFSGVVRTGDAHPALSL